MKKSLKRRLIFSAMISFFVLIILLVGSITVILYREQEQMSNAFIDTLLSEEPRLESEQRFPRAPPPNWFGYQFSRPTFPAGFYLITTDRAGNVSSVEKMGAMEGEEDVAALAARIVQQGADTGKTSAYKFRAVYEEQAVRVVLLDQTTQIAAVYTFVKAATAVGALCMLLLFIILQPIAGYAVEAWVRKTEQQKQFITNAGHELKTPVAIIMSNTEALELTQGENKYSRNIHQQADRLDKLIRQLLMIARVDEMRCCDQTEKIDFSLLVEESFRAFDAPLAERGIAVNLQIAPAAFLRGHRESLRQMLAVLLDNAVQYGKENGSIHAELTRSHGQLLLTLTNDVDCLPDCEPGQLLERFYRGSKARTQSRTAGCGVGLSAARTIARLHRGNIAITYPDKHSFRVTITLPLKN